MKLVTGKELFEFYGPLWSALRDLEASLFVPMFNFGILDAQERPGGEWTLYLAERWLRTSDSRLIRVDLNGIPERA